MNYVEWADEYFENARRVRNVIEKKKLLMKNEKMTADARKAVSDAIIAYRRIYRELLQTAEHLRSRAGESCHEA